MLKNKGELTIYFGASYPIGNEELLLIGAASGVYSGGVSRVGMSANQE